MQKDNFMKKIISLIIAVVFISTITFSQGYYFGLKGGPTLGFQQWNNIDQNVLIRYHGSVFIESLAEPGEFVLFAQTGYHEKGSSLRGLQVRNVNNVLTSLPTQGFIFRNIDLVLGVKQRLNSNFLGSTSAYYAFGIRGEYTVDDNLDEFSALGAFSPLPGFVEEWNYGATLSGGFEFQFSKFVGAVFEFSVHPDFSFQYIQPDIGFVRNPITGIDQTISARRIRNTALEISLGLRFLREIIYVD